MPAETPPEVPSADAVLDALPRAVVVCDLAGTVLRRNAMADHMYGAAAFDRPANHIGDCLVAGEGSAVWDEILVVVAEGRTWTGDLSLKGADGSLLAVHAINRPLRDADGSVRGMVSVSEDVSERRRFEQAAADQARHLELALEAGGLGTWRWDMRTGETVWDERLERIFGLEPGTFGGTYEAWLALQHPDDVEEVVQAVERAVAEASAYDVEHRVVWPDGTVRWIQGRGQVVISDDGEVIGTLGCVADATERVEAQRERERLLAEARDAVERERQLRERFEFITTVNDVLRATLDLDELMAAVTQVAVPRLGDWCSIHVMPPAGGEPLVEVAHVDPAMVAYARELQDRYPYDPDAPQGVPAVIRTGRTEFFPEITDEVVAAAAIDEEQERIVRELALRSAIVVPLTKRDRVLGAMQFVRSRPGRPYDTDDVALAEAVAIRIASAIDNLRLGQAQRDIAHTLQRSLLPGVLPEIPSLEVAVRYWPAGEATEVGGDFYDVFAVEDGAWGVAIGDVCGTGPAAAALTGLARHTIRTAAWHGDTPADVLGCLNEAIGATGESTFVTALFGRYEAATRTLTLAIGGHPLPVLVRADGECRQIGRPGTMLGPFDSPRLEEVTIELRPGDTVVCYTDGITDVPPPSALDAEDMVAMARAAVCDADSADEAIEGLRRGVAAVLPIEQRTDDIAVLVLHVGD